MFKRAIFKHNYNGTLIYQLSLLGKIPVSKTCLKTVHFDHWYQQHLKQLKIPGFIKTVVFSIRHNKFIMITMTLYWTTMLIIQYNALSKLYCTYKLVMLMLYIQGDFFKFATKTCKAKTNFKWRT